MADAINAVEAEMRNQIQPMHKETKELLRNYNQKCRKADHRTSNKQA